MMEFLKTLMESQYFTLGIFGIVAVLAVIFLILLLGGNKKEKIIDKAIIEEEITTDSIDSVVSHPEEMVNMNPNLETNTIEPVKEFSPEEFTPEQTNNQSYDMFTSTPSFETNTPVEQNIEPNVIEPVFNSELIVNETIDNEPVFGSGNNVLDASPDVNFEPEINKSEELITPVFAPKQDEIPIEIVPPEPTLDLPKLNTDAEVKQNVPVENEIPMPTAEAPRPFDIENIDL